MPDTTFTPPKVNKPSGIVPTQTTEKEAPKEVLERTFSIDSSVLSGSDPTTITIQDDKTGTVTPAKVDKGTSDGQKPDGQTSTPPSTERGEPGTKADAPVVEQKLTSVLKPPGQTKPEEKKGDKTEVPAVQQVTVPKGDKVVRNYEGLAAHEIQMAKQMSDSAYKWAMDLRSQVKELSKTKDSVYYQHPEAYRLAPQYQEAQQQAALADYEYNHWLSSLELADQGKPFKALTGFENKDGKIVPVFDGEVQPTAKIVEQLRINLQAAKNGRDKFNSSLQTMGQQYQQVVQNDNQIIQAERAKRFEWVAKPELLDYSVNVGGQDKTLKQIQTDFKSLFPHYYQSHPALEIAADMMVAMCIQKAQLDEAMAGQQNAQAKQEELRRGEPSSVVKPTPEPDPVHGVKTFDLSGMPS